MNLSKRVDNLENRRKPPGKTFVVYGPDDQEPTPEALAEFEQQLETARANLGPDDRLIKVIYGEWP